MLNERGREALFGAASAEDPLLKAQFMQPAIEQEIIEEVLAPRLSLRRPANAGVSVIPAYHREIALSNGPGAQKTVVVSPTPLEDRLILFYSLKTAVRQGRLCALREAINEFMRPYLVEGAGQLMPEEFLGRPEELPWQELDAARILELLDELAHYEEAEPVDNVYQVSHEYAHNASFIAASIHTYREMGGLSGAEWWAIWKHPAICAGSQPRSRMLFDEIQECLRPDMELERDQWLELFCEADVSNVSSFRATVIEHNVNLRALSH